MVIMKVVAGRPSGINIADIATTSAMPRTTVQRLVEAMEAEGLLFSPPNSKLYRLGFALRHMVDAADWKINSLVRPFLEALSAELNETTALALLNKEHVVYLDIVVGTQTLQAVLPLGAPMPLHSLATGKALLALLDEQALARIQQKAPLEKYTPLTITSWPRMLKEIETIRRLGYATDFGENASEIGALAVAFAGAFGELLSISIAGPVERIKKRQKELLVGLENTRIKLCKALIGTGL